MKSKPFSIIIGLIAIAVGIGYGMQALGYIDHFSVFFKGWWTVFIIVPGLIMLFTRGSNKLVSLGIIFLGFALFLYQQDVLGNVKKLVWPAIIIVFGLSMIISAISGGKKKNNNISFPEIPEDGSIPVFEAAFGEVEPDYYGRVFEGCSMDITFGSGTLDLRNAIIDKEVSISINTAFSGIKIRLPQGCRVDLQTSASFGGVENHYSSSDDPDAPIVHIFVAVSFGGVDIK